MVRCKHAGLPEPGLILSVVLSSIYSVFQPFGVTVKWTDSLALLQIETQHDDVSSVRMT